MLPANFDSWKSLYWQQEDFRWQWESLRTFFSDKGYALYVYQGENSLKPKVENDPANDSFGLLGVQTDFLPIPLFWCMVCIILRVYVIYTESYSVNLQRAEVWGACDSSVPF
jgi:hypothetical protein